MKRLQNTLATLTAAVGAVVLACFPVATPASAAGLLIADGGLGGNLEIAEHTVRVTLNNGIAVTEVTQVFQNQEDRQVEALYTFPVPRGASVSNFSMWINGKEMTGEVVEKQRAREIYNSYKQVRRDPGLLEQTDFRTFEMRIFPIAPKAAQRVQITYAQQLDFDHDRATYVYPLASTTRKDVAGKQAGKFSFTLDAKSEVPITILESPTHPKDFVIAKHDPSYYQASLELSGASLQRDVVLSYQASRPKTGMDIITSRAGKEDGYFMLTLTAGEELALHNKGMDYVFVMDVSGSMQDEEKLAMEEKSVAAFVEALGKDDRFEVLTFNVKLGSLFNQLKTADEAAKKDARRFIDSQDARGGTILKPALTTAYQYADKDRPLNVVLLSDGLTEQGETKPLMDLMAQHPANTRVFAIGVGNDVNRALLEQVADKTGGLAAFLSRGDSFERQASAFRRKLLRPAATDLKLAFQGTDVYDLEPPTMGNLYYGSPVRVYGRYKTPGPVKATLEGRINGEAFKREFNIDLPREDLNNPQIERMWALGKVDRLQKEADATGSRSAVIPEIIRLGEGYSIVTEYTSFLVLENDGEFQRWKIDRKNALRVERDRAAQANLQARLDKLRNAAPEAGPMAAAPKPAQLATAAPTIAPVSSPVSTPSSAAPAPTGRGFDLGLPTGGGGAIDPVSGVIVLGLGIAGLTAARNARKHAGATSAPDRQA